VIRFNVLFSSALYRTLTMLEIIFDFELMLDLVK
jgi:hypothetical protein